MFFFLSLIRLINCYKLEWKASHHSIVITRVGQYGPSGRCLGLLLLLFFAYFITWRISVGIIQPLRGPILHIGIWRTTNFSIGTCPPPPLSLFCLLSMSTLPKNVFDVFWNGVASYTNYFCKHV